jgi:hypothetical protein
LTTGGNMTRTTRLTLIAVVTFAVLLAVLGAQHEHAAAQCSTKHFDDVCEYTLR